MAQRQMGYVNQNLIGQQQRLPKPVLQDLHCYTALIPLLCCSRLQPNDVVKWKPNVALVVMAN